MHKLEIKNEGKVFEFSHWIKDHINFRKKKKKNSLIGCHNFTSSKGKPKDVLTELSAITGGLVTRHGLVSNTGLRSYSGPFVKTHIFLQIHLNLLDS